MDTNSQPQIKKPWGQYISLVISLLGIGYILITSFRLYTYGNYDIAAFSTTVSLLAIVTLISSICLTLFLTLHKTFKNRVKKLTCLSSIKTFIFLFIFLLGTFFLGKVYYSLLNQSKINRILASLSPELQVNQKPIPENEKV